MAKSLRRKRPFWTCPNRDVTKPHSTWLPFVLAILLSQSTEASDKKSVLPQTVPPPRHADYHLAYFSEIPASTVEFQYESEFLPTGPATTPPNNNDRQQERETRLELEWENNNHDDDHHNHHSNGLYQANHDDDNGKRYAYDWHVYVDTALEEEEGPPPARLPPRTLLQNSQPNETNERGLAHFIGMRDMWKRIATNIATFRRKALEGTRFTSSWQQPQQSDDPVARRTQRISTTTNFTNSSPPTNTMNATNTTSNITNTTNTTKIASSPKEYEVVNQGNITTDEGTDDYNLYPYVNDTSDYYEGDVYPHPNQTYPDQTGKPGSKLDGGAGIGVDETGSPSPDGKDPNASSTPMRGFGPLRIRAILTDTLEEETGNSILNEEERNMLLMETLRPAMVAWGEALRVRRVQGNLTLDPHQLVDGHKCGPGPFVPIPEEHLRWGFRDTDFVLYLHVARQSFTFTPDVTHTTNSTDLDSWNETLVPSEEEVAVEDQDGGHEDPDGFVNVTNSTQPAKSFVPWNRDFEQVDNNNETEAPSDDTAAPTASPIDSAYLCSGDYIAASAFCNTDQFDRPVAAILHLCIDDNFFHPERRDRNIRTLMHELGHALGFNAVSLAHFRRFDGTPRTPRLANGAVPLQTVQCTGPQEMQQERESWFKTDDDGGPQDRRLRLGEPKGLQNTVDAVDVEPTTLVGHYDSIPLPSEEILQFGTVRGGVRVALIVTPSVLQVVRNHFGCQTLEGAELESGESTCLGDHWERRLFKTDLMNPIIDSDMSLSSRISTITLAYFADSGWYQVDLSKASIAASWGRGAGCPFVEEPCIGHDGQVSPGFDSLFCSRKTSSLLTLDGCTHDILKKASCLMDRYPEQLPLVYQYFDLTYGSNVGGPDPFVDYCPYYAGFKNGMCSDRQNEDVIKVSDMERVGSRNSRCLAGMLSFGKTALCLRIACVVEDKSLRVQVDNVWYTCKYEGQVISTRLGVKVFCPNPVRTCPTFYCPRDCLGSPQLICDYEQGECVCPEDNALPSDDGSCPAEEDASDTDGSDDLPGISSVDIPQLEFLFYRPAVMEQEDLATPSDDSPMQDIYFPDARALIEQTLAEEPALPKRRWPMILSGTLLVSMFVVVLWTHHSRNRRRQAQTLPSTMLDTFDDDDDDHNNDGNTTHLTRRFPGQGNKRGLDKQKMMATVLVDLRLQDQFRDFLVQRDTETDVASMTDTEGDRSNASASFVTSHRPPIPAEHLRPTIVEIPPLQPLEIRCPSSTPSASIRRRKRRFL